MTPAARVQAAIEVLDQILAGAPAEQALTGWSRGARYAGSKDRAAVRDHVFQALRCRRSYAALGGGSDGRAIMLGQLRALSISLEDTFSGQGYAPNSLNQAELESGRQPLGEAEALDIPDWLWPRFVASLGEAEASQAARLLQDRAPIALRVNARLNSAAQVTGILKEDGVEATLLPDIDTALAVTDGARRIKSSRAYLEGRVELQDAASQAAMAQLQIAPGGRVLDYCAGGGGKTLALAARVSAQWFANDTAPARMRDLPTRAARAGVKVTCLDPSQLEAAAPFDLVLCDAPCSGSGTWRRAPDAKWRLTEVDLAALCEVQKEILSQAQGLVHPAGQLAYATCSVLREENEESVAAFLSSHPGWRLDMERRWSVTEANDGFYLAVFSKQN